MQHHASPVPHGHDVYGRTPVVPFLAAILAVLAGYAAPVAAAGPSFTSGAVTVEQPWSRATPHGSDSAVGYLTIRNTGDAPDRLVSASSDIAGRVGPHSMVMTNGIMQMRPLPEGIAIPPHDSVVLAPNGDHLMFEALKRPLRVEDQFPVTLTFEKAGAVPVTFTVESIGARSPNGSMPSKGGTPPKGGMSMKMN